jgi:hypothetical protein
LIEKEPSTIKRKEKEKKRKENLYTHEGDNKTTTKIKQTLTKPPKQQPPKPP